MCNPAAGAFAIGGLTTGASYLGQKQAADAQEKVQKRASAAEQIRAARANTSIRIREVQENIARSQRKESAQLQTTEAKARARLVALTESGVAGMSLDRVTDKLSAKGAKYSFSEDRQKEFQTQQAAFSLEEGAIRSTMNQLRINKPIKQASLLQAGIEGAKTGMSMYQALD